jgi:hypothetical protein
VGLSAVHGIVVLAAFVLGTLHFHDLWLGRGSAEEWRHRVTLNDPLPAYRACTELPAGSKVLVVGEGRPWGCSVPHHVSSSYEAQLIEDLVAATASSRQLARELVARGFSHLLVNWAEIDRLRQPPVRLLTAWTPEEELRWRSLLREECEFVWRKGGLELRRLR